MLFKCCYF